MKNKKIILILIIVLIVLLLAGGAFAYIYLQTDLLKTGQQTFYKYASKNASEIINVVQDKDLEDYMNAKISTPYTHDGTLNVSAKEDSSSSSNTNYSPISFSGKVDIPNQNRQEQININYSNTVKLALKFIQNQDKYGIGCDEIISNYIAVSTKDLPELVEKLDMGSGENLPTSSTNLSNFNISEAEIKTLTDKYSEIIKNNVPESCYKKGKDESTLTLNSEQLKTIETKLLTTLEGEEIITNKIGDSNLIEDYQKEIEKLIDTISNDATTDNYLKVTVYKCDDGVGRIILENKDATTTIAISNNQISITNNKGTTTIVITKEKSTDKLTQTIEATSVNEDNKTAKINLSISYAGLTTMSNVQEKISASIQNLSMKESNNNALNSAVSSISDASIEFNNSVKFVDTVDVEQLTNENSVSLNSYSKEDLSSLMTAIIMQTMSVNYSKMQEAGTLTSQDVAVNLINGLQ